MMQQLSERSRIFLGEMGVGAQWTLRAVSATATAAGASADTGVDTVDDVATDATFAPPAYAEAPAAALADHEAPAAPAAPVAAEPVKQPATEPVAPPSAEPVASPAAVSVAATTTTATAAATTATTTTTTTTAAASDDSNAWFDDVPVPRRASPVGAEAIAAMDWAALAGAIAACTRCDLCGTRRDAVPGRGPAGSARWLALAAAPGRLDEKDRRAVSGDAGLLLDNMLKAAGLTAATDVHVTHLVKCRPAGPDGADRAPTQDEVTACRPFLERELALTGAAVIVTFGQAAARGLLGAGAARGKVHRHGARPVVATYHPDDLLRRPEDKAKSWADLCLARGAHD